jgi:hypothetical protein
MNFNSLPLPIFPTFADSGEPMLTTPHAITQENVGPLRDFVRVSAQVLVELGVDP